MKIRLTQKDYNRVELTLSGESLDALLDHIGEDQIEMIEITIRKPEAADEVH